VSRTDNHFVFLLNREPGNIVLIVSLLCKLTVNKSELHLLIYTHASTHAHTHTGRTPVACNSNCVHDANWNISTRISQSQQATRAYNVVKQCSK